MPKLLDCQREIVSKHFRVASQELRDTILKRIVDSRARIYVIDVQTHMQSLKSSGIQTTHPLLYDTHTCICHTLKLSKLQKYGFHHYKT